MQPHQVKIKVSKNPYKMFTYDAIGTMKKMKGFWWIEAPTPEEAIEKVKEQVAQNLAGEIQFNIEMEEKHA